MKNEGLPLFRKFDLSDTSVWSKIKGNPPPTPGAPCKKQHEDWSSQALLQNLHTKIIICFHDEPWSTVIRTVYSALYSAGSNPLVSEVILIDDDSDFEDLKEPLEKWVSLWGGRVRLLRANGRQGLIRARLAGAVAADEYKLNPTLSSKNLVLTFLDAHCECADNWLQPLISRISVEPKAFVSPVIDVINTEDFELHAGNPGATQVGAFDWKLDFRWFGRQHEKDDISPRDSPAMAGGLFSVARDAFVGLGEYDQEMKIWGGENIEMSLRVWMCGGRLEVIPCSHVGHIFRSFNAHGRGLEGTSVGDESEKNKVRTAKVWLDQKHFKIFEKADVFASSRISQIGDINFRIDFKDRLQCKSSEWYFENVFPELWQPEFSEMVQGENYGVLMNNDKCIFAEKTYKSLEMKACPANKTPPRNNNQYYWYWDHNRKEMRLHPNIGNGQWQGECMASQGLNVATRLEPCDFANKNVVPHRLFELKPIGGGFLIHPSGESRKCLTHDTNMGSLKVENCVLEDTDDLLHAVAHSPAKEVQAQIFKFL